MWECYTEKDASLTIYTPASISLLASLFLSQASSCLLLSEVIEMQHRARWQTHTHSVIDTGAAGLGHMLSKDWEAWHPADCASALHLLSLLRIKDVSETPDPRAPFYSPVLFFLNHPQLLHQLFPSHDCPRKIKRQRREHGGDLEQDFHCAEVLCVTACMKLPLTNIFNAPRAQCTS